MNNKYVIISPCRDEAEYMKKTLESVVHQTLLPSKWIIVDDGSTDETPSILSHYASKYPFIEIVTRKDRGYRKVGPGVIDAFYEGYSSIDSNEYDYICKLDLDLELPTQYFGILIERMELNPRIATCSGKPYNEINGVMVSEKRGDEMSVGMTKLYRMHAFKQIGGFVREVMWDAIDCHKCRQFGWQAFSWDDPELRFNHLRMMGSSQQNILVGRMRHGFGQQFMGTGFIYMTATSVFRGTQPPFIIGGMAMLWGYIKSKFAGDPKLDDDELIKLINRFQWACLIKGKKKAVQSFDEVQAKQWDKNRKPTPMPMTATD
jgi:glycosyltransferase involved in cell wall biosynthesis